MKNKKKKNQKNLTLEQTIVNELGYKTKPRDIHIGNLMAVAVSSSYGFVPIGEDFKIISDTEISYKELEEVIRQYYISRGYEETHKGTVYENDKEKFIITISMVNENKYLLSADVYDKQREKEEMIEWKKKMKKNNCKEEK